MGGCQNGGEGLVLLAAAAAIRLAQGKSPDEVGLLAAFFTVLGDQLALLALCSGENNGSDVKSS